MLDTPSEIPDSFKQALQNGYEKPEFHPGRFAKLPREVIDEMRPIFAGGGLRWTPLVISHMAARAKAQARKGGSVAYESVSHECEIGPDEFVYTQASCAEDFLARFGLGPSDVYDESGDFTGDARRQYQQLHRAFKQSRGVWAEERRECKPGTKVLGTIWTLIPFTMDQVEALPSCQSLDYRPTDLDEEELLDFCTDRDGYVDVACWYQLLAHRYHPERFRYAETCSSVRDRGTYSDAVAWAQAFARDGSCPHAGDSGDRHMSIGAFRDVDIGKMGPSASTPCTTPWIVLEPEGGEGMAPIVDRFEATCDILETLDVEGADLSKVVVSYSGNKSFHIRIPAGMVGCPVFESSDTAETVLRRFADRITDHELDANLFDPRHLIRCIGSVHEETGRHVSAVHGDTFQRLSLEEMIASSEGHVPFALKDPFDVDVGPLRDHMHAACETLTRFWIPGFDEVDVSGGSGNVVQRAMQGIEEGEHWHERHHGRNKATFIAACHLIEKHGQERAWTKLQDVNDRHSPPLPRTEVETCFESAKRTVN